MNSYRWNVAVLAIVFSVVAATAAVNYKLNFYGLFGDVKGKKYIVYDNERTTKYLFSYNYIPHNFDGLLLGSSSTGNWNTGELSGMRIYNASVSGGNATEEALVVNRILQASHPRLALLLIHPYLTETHGRKSGFMNPQEYWGALGSIQLFRGYWRKWLVEHGYARQEFNEFGSDDFVVPERPLPPAPGLVQTQPSFFIDDQGLDDYRAVLGRLRSSGARIVGIIPPVQMERWKIMQAEFGQYCAKIRPLFHEDEPVIDLNGSDFEAFKRNPDNYQDEVHLSHLGASSVIQTINKRLEQMGLVGVPAAPAETSDKRSSFDNIPRNLLVSLRFDWQAGSEQNVEHSNFHFPRRNITAP